MEMYEYIRFSHFNLKHSIRKIHRTTGLDRKTIRKAISGVTPKYKVARPRQKTVIGPYVDIIRTWLCQDKRTPKKQRHTTKGGVEGSVGYVRRNFLTPIPKVNCLEELNTQLLEKCLNHDLNITSGQQESVGQLFEKEKSKLLGLPRAVYNNFTLHPVVVDKYLTIKLKRNRYSVPSGYRNKQVTAELGLDEVRIVYKNQLLARHKREHRRDYWIINPWHYLEALRRKPGAFKSSRILTEREQSWDAVVKKTYDLQVKKYGQIEGAKEFISTLLYFKDRSYEDMITVLELSIEQKTVSKETVAMVAEATNESLINVEDVGVAKIPAIANFSIPEADVSRFDILMEVSNG